MKIRAEEISQILKEQIKNYLMVWWIFEVFLMKQLKTPYQRFLKEKVKTV